MKTYSVNYFDTLRGGAGLVTVRVEELHTWLADNPGFLIRVLTPDWLTV